MTLTASEYRGSVLPGRVTDVNGTLVTVTAPDGTPFGASIPGVLTDVDGRLVVTTGAIAAIQEGLPRAANGAMVTVAVADGTPFGSVISGLLTDAAGRVVTAAGPPAAIQNGLPRAANGALAVLGATQLRILNNAESQASGTTVTQANSGGASANAFDTAPVIGANMTLTYDNATPMHGANAFKFALTSTATAITYVEWTSTTFGSALSRFFGAFYFRTNVASIAATIRLVSFLSGGTLVGRLSVVNGNQGFQFRNNADVAIGTISGAIAANTWYRVEFDVTCGASGAGTATVYAGDGTTALNSASFTATSFGTVVDNIRFGFNTAAFSVTAGDFVLLDDLNVNGTGVPGPGPYT
jgi:hypothetical protein